jgi:hypothetical protein
VLDRILLKRTIARLTGLTAVSLLVVLSLSPATGAKESKPTVSAFTASADSPRDVVTVSPFVLYNSGGSITLTADVTNATACVFSSNRPIAGMPTTIPCANGPVTAAGVDVPANAGKRDAKYKFHLRVFGRGTARSTPLTVIVSTQPMPPPVPDCIETGSTWDFSVPALPAISFQETFGPGFTFTSTSNLAAFGGGSYAVVDGVLTETFKEGGVVTGIWNGSEYFGLIDLPYLGETGFAVEPTAALGAGC